MAVIALTVVGAWFLSRTRQQADGTSPAIEVKATASSSRSIAMNDSTGIAEIARSAAAPDLASSTVRDTRTVREVVLAEFGDQADEALRRLEANGWNLDEMGPPRTSWDEARRVLEGRLMPDPGEERAWRETVLEWPEKLSSDWLQEHLALGDRKLADWELAEIEGVAAEYLERAKSRADEMFVLLKLTLKRVWDQDRFSRRPYVYWESHPAGTFYSNCDGDGFWTYGISLVWDDCPGMRESYAELERIAAERDKKIREYLKRTR